MERAKVTNTMLHDAFILTGVQSGKHAHRAAEAKRLGFGLTFKQTMRRMARCIGVVSGDARAQIGVCRLGWVVARCTPRALQIYCRKYFRREARSESGELSRDGHRSSTDQ